MNGKNRNNCGFVDTMSDDESSEDDENPKKQIPKYSRSEKCVWLFCNCMLFFRFLECVYFQFVYELKYKNIYISIIKKNIAEKKEI